MSIFDSPESYIAGLFDGGGNVYFRISQSNRELGYRINPTIIIHINRNDELYGFLDEFFVENQIQFKISSTENGAKRIEIDTRDNVVRFLELVRGETIQHASSTNFILDNFYPTRDCGDILQEQKFIKMVETIEMLQPRRVSNDSVKYDSAFFYDKWDIDSNVSPVMIPSTHDEVELEKDYLAGFFDGAGKIRPVIHESETTSLGYSISLRVGMTRSWLRDSTIEKIKSNMKKNDIEYNINEQGSRTSIHVTDHESIERFLDSVQPLLISNFEISMLTLDKIMPAFRDNYHRTKQGIHDIVALYEHVMDSKVDRKYTASFFENQWNNVRKLQF